jgi:exosortase
VRSNEDASHIPLIPLISCGLLYLQHKELRVAAKYDAAGAAIFLVPGILLKFLANYSLALNQGDSLTVTILALLCFVLAGYVAIFGRAIARETWFALAFLFFCVPLPDALLDRVIYLLQAGSAAVAEFLFDLSGAPFLREGFIFRLPRMSIEVAQECSGIRSSIALIILAVLISHFSFRAFWKKVVFVVAGIMIMLIKNGVRIATLTLLANYVNPDFLYGNLHHRGGIVFFVLGLILLLPVYCG